MAKTRRAAATLILILCLTPSFHAALLPPWFVDCVVAIGRKEINPVTHQPGQWIPEASGFLYGRFVAKKSDTENTYALYLVTNRHVIEEHAALPNSASLWVKFNLETAGAYEIQLQNPDGKPSWHGHPNGAVDVAVIPINPPFLKSEGARFGFFKSDREVLNRQKAKEVGLTEGDGAFVLGFPMGLVDRGQDYVIVRQGAIAKVRSALDSSTESSFLLDCFIFPGNSGGPVVLKPEIVAIDKTKPISQAYLLGIVKGYIPYVDVAVSAQTKRPRVTFEENSGLAEVILVDYIDEAIDDLTKTATTP
jgi:hypothetical protein